MANSPLTRKLGIKPGMRIVLVGAPDGYEAMLDPLPDGASVGRDSEQGADLVQVFGADLAELAPRALEGAALVRPGGLLWLTYPKLEGPLAGDLKRIVVWGLLDSINWRAVSQIAVDDTWTALRFRPAADVRSR